MLQCGLMVFVLSAKQAMAYTKVVAAQKLIEESQSRQAVEIYRGLENTMSGTGFFWSNYGYALCSIRNFNDGIEKLELANKLSSLPSTYLILGNAYKRIKRYEDAKQCFQFLHNVQPSKFRPYVELFKLYTLQKDTLNATLIAEEIVDKKAKVPSEEVNNIKQMAIKFLNAN